MKNAFNWSPAVTVPVEPFGSLLGGGSRHGQFRLVGITQINRLDGSPFEWPGKAFPR